jgi:hypothetical protein
MNSDEMTSTTYLQELYNVTQGNTETQVSMHDTGINLGFDKAESGRIAEELMVQGYIELKTLAGGISITDEGLRFLGFTPQSNRSEVEALTLSSGPIVNEDDKAMCKKVMSSIQNELSTLELDFPSIEQIVLDLKAMDIHLLSSSPKTAVLLELFRSISDCFDSNTESRTRTGLTDLLQ